MSDGLPRSFRMMPDPTVNDAEQINAPGEDPAVPSQGRDEGEGKVKSPGFYLLFIHVSDEPGQPRCFKASAETWS